MEKALEFLQRHKDIAFATIGEDGKPKLRVFQIMKMENTNFYFATVTSKEVYRQLQLNPYVEFLAMQGQLSVRVSGRVDFNVEKEKCREIYENNKNLQRLYYSYRDLVYFRIVTNKIDYYDLTPNPPLLEGYDIS
ncbi:MAG: pyridoxamine 5'-phosphate oxidase family protein [Odoribacter sp.]|nr:pyridoxamine 5'-phosphate oxidase family protein [Odoribacter sp.]